MGDGEGVNVDPMALNTFAMNMRTPTDEFVNGLKDKDLTKELYDVRSALPSGMEFVKRHMSMINQFTAFMLDAAGGTIALAQGANTIAVNVLITDRDNAMKLAMDLASNPPMAKGNTFELIDVSSVANQPGGGVRDVTAAFSPTEKNASMSVRMAHDLARQRPSGGTQTTTPGAKTPARRTPASKLRRDLSAAQLARQKWADKKKTLEEQDVTETKNRHRGDAVSYKGMTDRAEHAKEYRRIIKLIAETKGNTCVEIPISDDRIRAN